MEFSWTFLSSILLLTALPRKLNITCVRFNVFRHAVIYGQGLAHFLADTA